MAKDICGTCGQEEPTQASCKKRCKRKNQNIGWISCDSCDKWFHTVCVRVSSLLLADISSYWYFCENCTVRGTLVQKQVSSPTGPTSSDLAKITSTISELSEELVKVQTELEICRSTCRKQIDKLRNQLQTSEQLNDKNSAQRELVADIEKKLEVIESGAKLANTCLRSVNDHRIAINKIPFREGENVKVLVKCVFQCLGIDEADSCISSCFRIPVKASKWSDRSISPTIVVVFNSKEVKEKVLKLYFENFTRAKLSALQTGLALEYRFTVNEVLSLHSFRIRNLALRLKHRKLVDSVFVRNDSVSVRLPNHKRYTVVSSSDHLLELTGRNTIGEVAAVDESSLFFDAVSANSSARSQQ